MSDLVYDIQDLAGILAGTQTFILGEIRVLQLTNDKHTTVFATTLIYILLLTDILVVECLVWITYVKLIQVTLRIATRA